MPDISSVGHGSLDPLSRPGTASRFSANGLVREVVGTPRESDRVELSGHARFLDLLQNLPEGRLEQVEAVRNSIDAGTYETDEKLGLALGRLLEDLDGPIVRVTTPHIPLASADCLEDEMLPSVEKIVSSVTKLVD